MKNRMAFYKEKFMEYSIRKMTVSEYPMLNDFLYEAIFIPDGIEPPPRNIITSPELQIYVDRFGELKDDFALVAEVEKKVVGAVWVRIMNDYGHIDDKTPSLAISLYKEYRGQGIGTDMMKEMLSLLKAHGYKRVSLSVQKTNYAVEMYRKIGFDIVRGNEEEWIMLWQEGKH
ncbi:acetyltransferase, GNAT family [Blautia hydrogenotrophica DSM 10507]|uniref:N-acetyltransferase domain-containing protein n=2 Tax=Blautia hydrogenotrophica TaxID=53443 RepID=C0CRP4_BLAHS|nr:acetyltransferase, GNAT family [Blautia hydrogenotrophica DSM 10507]